MTLLLTLFDLLKIFLIALILKNALQYVLIFEFFTQFYTFSENFE